MEISNLLADSNSGFYASINLLVGHTKTDPFLAGCIRLAQTKDAAERCSGGLCLPTVGYLMKP